MVRLATHPGRMFLRTPVLAIHRPRVEAARAARVNQEGLAERLAKAVWGEGA